MGSLLEEFKLEGLLPERVVVTGADNGSNPGEVPKVDPDAPQNTSPDNVANTANDAVKDAGDQNKDDDDTKPADDNKFTDTLMNATAKAMEAAAAAMENIVEACGKNHVEYADDKVAKLTEIYESMKQLQSNMYELARMENYGSSDDQDQDQDSNNESRQFTESRVKVTLDSVKKALKDFRSGFDKIEQNKDWIVVSGIPNRKMKDKIAGKVFDEHVKSDSDVITIQDMPPIAPGSPWAFRVAVR